MRTGEQVGAPRMYKFSIKHCLVFLSGHPLKYPWCDTNLFISNPTFYINPCIGNSGTQISKFKVFSH